MKQLLSMIDSSPDVAEFCEWAASEYHDSPYDFYRETGEIKSSKS